MFLKINLIIFLLINIVFFNCSGSSSEKDTIIDNDSEVNLPLVLSTVGNNIDFNTNGEAVIRGIVVDTDGDDIGDGIDLDGDNNPEMIYVSGTLNSYLRYNDFFTIEKTVRGVKTHIPFFLKGAPDITYYFAIEENSVTITIQTGEQYIEIIIVFEAGIILGFDINSDGIVDDDTLDGTEPTDVTGISYYTIGGTVSGLLGEGLVIQNNSDDDLNFLVNGEFVFTSSLEDLSEYNVTILTQPSNPSQACVITNSSGIVSGDNVANINISCSTNSFTIGGTVSGFVGSDFVIQNNLADDLAIFADGSFSFSTSLDDLSLYSVSVLTNPTLPAQTCVVTNGDGSLNGSNISNIEITCSTDTFAVGGTVSNLLGIEITLQNNLGDDLVILTNGVFQFSTLIEDMAGYDVTILSQPTTPNQTCVVTNGNGIIAVSDVINISITCTGAITQITAAKTNTCALLDTNAMRCWGRGDIGALGYGNISNVADGVGPDILTAGNVSVGGNVKAISSECNSTCALLDTGDIRCWGDANSGILGYGNTTQLGDDEVPSSVGIVPVGGTVDQVVVGTMHTCALLDTGNVRCWGSGNSGRLGYGNTNNVADGIGVDIITAGDVSIGGNVIQIALGRDHTCVLLDTYNIRCWGYNANGQLGYGNTSNVADGIGPDIVTVGDVNVGGPVAQITTGSYHTCALLDTGAIRCWGRAFEGQLGYGNTTAIGDNELPSVAGDISIGGTAVQISAGYNHTCALLDIGAIRCWGMNTSGQLGYGNIDTIGDNELPSTAGDIPIGGIVTQIDAGEDYTCALMDSGEMRCWGKNNYGQLGYGNLNNIGDDELPSVAGDILVW